MEISDENSEIEMSLDVTLMEEEIDNSEKSDESVQCKIFLLGKTICSLFRRHLEAKISSYNFSKFSDIFANAYSTSISGIQNNRKASV